MPKPKGEKLRKGDSDFAKTKQIRLKGITLKMFEFDVKSNESSESAIGFEIIKRYYKENKPFGFTS